MRIQAAFLSYVLHLCNSPVCIKCFNLKEKRVGKSELRRKKKSDRSQEGKKNKTKAERTSKNKGKKKGRMIKNNRKYPNSGTTGSAE